MKKEVGLWIDHREAFLVITTDEGEQTTQIYSDIESNAQFSGSSRSVGSQVVKIYKIDNIQTILRNIMMPSSRIFGTQI